MVSLPDPCRRHVHLLFDAADGDHDGAGGDDLVQKTCVETCACGTGRKADDGRTGASKQRERPVSSIWNPRVRREEQGGLDSCGMSVGWIRLGSCVVLGDSVVVCQGVSRCRGARMAVSFLIHGLAADTRTVTDGRWGWI